MKPEAFLFVLAAATPIAGYFCRNPLLRIGLSALVTAGLISACLIVGESRAQDSDFDVVFGIALAGWNVLAVVYVVICLVVMSAAATVCRRIWRRQPRDEK